MEVYLVRHTETAAGKGVCYGQTDVALKEPYLEAFEAVCRQLKLHDPMVFSSPLSRCTLLAQHIVNHHHITQPVSLDPRLKELNFGLWELLRWDDIALEALTPWMDDFVNQSTPQGESFAMLFDRVADFINSSLKNVESDRPVIIIAHAGVIRSFICYAQNIPLKDAFSVEVDYGGVYKVCLDTGSSLSTEIF